jgi:hypothetical protein
VAEVQVLVDVVGVRAGREPRAARRALSALCVEHWGEERECAQ